MFAPSDVWHAILDSSKYLGWNLGKVEHTQSRLRFEDYHLVPACLYRNLNSLYESK